MAVGIDVGGTKLLAVAVDSGGEILAERRLATPSDGDDLLDAVAEVALAVASADGGAEPVGVGVGVPGLVASDGVLRFAPNLPGVVGLDVAAGLRERLGEGAPGMSQRIVVDNDANCACMAERAFGAARGASDVLFVAIGTGVGGAIIAGGSLVRGANGYAGEVGHMTIDPDGRECVCGKRGCWEQYASGTALGRLAREAALAGGAPGLLALAGGEVSDVRGEHVVAAAADGDREAAEIFEQFGFWVAVGLANLTAILDPEVVVLGGGLIAAGELLLEPTRRRFLDQLEGAEFRPDTPIVPATLGENAGAVGAAALAFAAG